MKNTNLKKVELIYITEYIRNHYVARVLQDFCLSEVSLRYEGFFDDGLFCGSFLDYLKSNQYLQIIDNDDFFTHYCTNTITYFKKIYEESI